MKQLQLHPQRPLSVELAITHVCIRERAPVLGVRDLRFERRLLLQHGSTPLFALGESREQLIEVVGRVLESADGALNRVERAPIGCLVVERLTREPVTEPGRVAF